MDRPESHPPIHPSITPGKSHTTHIDRYVAMCFKPPRSPGSLSLAIAIGVGARRCYCCCCTLATATALPPPPAWAHIAKSTSPPVRPFGSCSQALLVALPLCCSFEVPRRLESNRMEFERIQSAFVGTTRKSPHATFIAVSKGRTKRCSR